MIGFQSITPGILYIQKPLIMKPYEPCIILGSNDLLNHVTYYFNMRFYSIFEFLYLLLATFQAVYSCTNIILVYLLNLPSRFSHGILKHPIYVCLSVCTLYSYMYSLVCCTFTKTDKHRFMSFIKNIHINHLKILIIHFSLVHLLEIPLIKETRVINK